MPGLTPATHCLQDVEGRGLLVPNGDLTQLLTDTLEGVVHQVSKGSRQ
jgi:hypothetical protein